MSEAVNEEGNGHAEKALAEGADVVIGLRRDEKHTLIFTLGSLMRLHKVLGKNPMAGELFQEIDPEKLATILWAGTLHESHGMTPEDFALKIRLEDIPMISEKVLQAYGQSIPLEKPEKKTEGSMAEALAETNPSVG